MKKIFILIAAVYVTSCGSNSVKEFQKTDTVLIVAQGAQGPFLDSAIRIRGKIRAFKDSNSLDGKMIEFEAFRIGQLTDTLRDSLGHPKMDNAKHIIIHLNYSMSFTDTSMNKFIKVIEFPKK